MVKFLESSSKLGSPLFISHEVQPFGRGPITHLGDLQSPWPSNATCGVVNMTHLKSIQRQMTCKMYLPPGSSTYCSPWKISISIGSRIVFQFHHLLGTFGEENLSSSTSHRSKNSPKPSFFSQREPRSSQSRKRPAGAGHAWAGIFEDGFSKSKLMARGWDFRWWVCKKRLGVWFSYRKTACQVRGEQVGRYFMGTKSDLRTWLGMTG